MIEWPTSDAIQYWSGVATIVALPFVIGAAIYAARQLSLARKAGSGATLIALTEAFRQNWTAFLDASDLDKKGYAFADLANSLEVACAVFRDDVFFGHSRDILEFYLVGVFRVLQDSQEARELLLALLQTRETFQNIREFVGSHQKAIASRALA